jgi:hypothetical protein
MCPSYLMPMKAYRLQIPNLGHTVDCCADCWQLPNLDAETFHRAQSFLLCTELQPTGGITAFTEPLHIIVE